MLKGISSTRDSFIIRAFAWNDMNMEINIARKSLVCAKVMQGYIKSQFYVNICVL